MPANTPHHHPHLIAVDWGTSALRAALICHGQTVAQRHSDQGILQIPQNGFAQALTGFCGDWMAHPQALTLICGMAGSAQGWQLAPYMACPSRLQNLTQHLVWVETGKVALVPGLACDLPHAPDVMRGEETQVLGALQLMGGADATVVLPGTHSKWVQVKNQQVLRFQTFMTGECFSLLKQHSILARTLSPTPSFAAPSDDLDETSFEQGVALALRGESLLHTLFSVRTLALMERLNPTQGLAYLSGLLIGEEIRAQTDGLTGPLLVVANPVLQKRYQRALALRGLDCQTMGDEATWTGLQCLASLLTRPTLGSMAP
jgi:2-dehydro-3-deoxygalactonokinase